MPENILRVQMFADKALRMSSYILHPMLMDFQQVHSVKNGNWALHTHFSDFELFRYIDAVASVTCEDVLSALNTSLEKEYSTLSIIKPKV